MTKEELQERIYGDYYKSEEERNAFIRDYLRNYKYNTPEVPKYTATINMTVSIFRLIANSLFIKVLIMAPAELK